MAEKPKYGELAASLISNSSGAIFYRDQDVYPVVSRRSSKPRPPRDGRERVNAVLRLIGEDPLMSEGMKAMAERASEFATPMAAKLAGVAVHPKARQHFDDELDRMWAAAAAKPMKAADEVVVGAGLHAAIYCAVRVAKGFPKPVVLEASDRVGGAFAVSRKASFYLNSRNRPGPLALPGMPGGLNVLPGAVVQPSDLSGDEYQRNADLAFSIRATLSMTASVFTGRRVVGTRYDDRDSPTHRYIIELEDGSEVAANRVVLALGLGTDNVLGDQSDRVLPFSQFMAHLDDPFPLRGMNRVAVVGAGDSGRTAVEALTGQGPSTGASVASLDWPERVDWYGCLQPTRADWERCNRSRYQGIGRFFPKTPGSYARVMPFVERATALANGFDTAYVNERPYDYVVTCTGFSRRRLTLDGRDWQDHYVGGRVVAQGCSDDDVYRIGPAARMSVSELEGRTAEGFASIAENGTALFRYAGRTAALAADLDAPRLIAA